MLWFLQCSNEADEDEEEAEKLRDAAGEYVVW